MVPSLLIVSLLFIFLPGASMHRYTRCGGTYTSARGIIHTPNFPAQFTVPIRCTWVIDAQQFITTEDNSNIYVYLTQLYVFEGLMFEEYQIYDDTYQLNGRVLHTVTENNVTKVSYIHSKQGYLVITLKLDTIESTHLRVLDHLLDVYGFNITYEISVGDVRPDRCTMLDCGFTGFCYDYYTKFSCDCFEGFAGPSCSQGANSLCTNHKGHTACNNGATCTHVGDSAIRCDCEGTGYTGDTCDDPVLPVSEDECVDCLISCPFDGQPKNVCKCPGGRNGSNSNSIIGYTGGIRVSALPNLRDSPLRAYVETQITTALKDAIPSIEQNVRVHSIHAVGRAGTWLVSWRLSDRRRRLEPKIRAAMADWVRLGRVGDIALADPVPTPDGGTAALAELAVDPPPVIQMMEIHPPGPIRVGDDITISCIVNGNAEMQLNWFNDGYQVNTNIPGSNKWSRIEELTPTLYQHVLGIDAITALDAGVFSCQVLSNQYVQLSPEHRLQHCLFRTVIVRAPPRVWIEPLSLTVRKGENFTIKCFSAPANTGGNHLSSSSSKYTYGWTKNKVLLPIKTDTEHYEVLYPMGSILQVSSINKSTSFSCLVQDETVLWSEHNILVHVVDRQRVRTCGGERHQRLLWPETAPGTDNVQECPQDDYQGHARRACSLRDDTGQPTWQRPDYSGCTPRRLIAVNKEFHRLSLGYSADYNLPSPSHLTNTLISYRSYIQEALQHQSNIKPTTPPSSGHPGQVLSSTASNKKADGEGMLLPGVGAKILMMVSDVLTYIDKRGIGKDNGSMTEVVMDIVDGVLERKDNIVDEKQVMLVQEVVKQAARIGLISPSSNNVYHRARANIDLTVTPGDKASTNAIGTGVNIPTALTNGYPPWYAYKLHVSLPTQPSSAANRTVCLVVVLYRNLHKFLPQRSAIRLKDGSEMDYEIISPITAAWIFIKDNITEKLFCSSNTCKFIMEFTHPVTNNRSLQAAWMLICARTEFANYGLGWETGSCITRAVDGTTTRCICPRSGTYALMLAMKPKSKEVPPPPSNKQILLILGCFCCLLLTTFSVLILLIYWSLRRSCLIFLKVQCCASIIGAMLTFIYALWDKIPEEKHLCIMSILEICLLVGLSSQLSKILIVYSELVSLPKMASIKQTVVLIITGSPLIAVFGNHLAYVSMNRRLDSWWLLHGSLSFNIFTSSTSIIVLLYFSLYYIVQRKLSIVIAQRDLKTSDALLSRVKLLRRSAIVFCGITAIFAVSVLYINFPTNIGYHYAFCSLCISLGCCILFCYVLCSETSPWPHLIRKWQEKSNEKPSSDASNHLKFFTKADVENESTPYFCSKGMAETHFIHESICHKKLSEMSPTSFKTYNSVQFSELPNTSQSISEHSPSIEDNMPFSSVVSDVHFHSPDVVGTKKFAQSDLIASVLTKDPIVVYQASVTQPTQKEQLQLATERLRPEGEEMKVKSMAEERASVSTTDVKDNDNMDAVMDSITNDLNYLLNDEYEQGSPSVGNSSGGVRRISRPPSIAVFEQIAEEAEEEGKVVLETSVMRTNC